MKKHKYTRSDLERNARAYNKYLTPEYLTGLSLRHLLALCHPSLRDEINNLGNIIFN